jgi:hypothetical protein
MAAVAELEIGLTKQQRNDRKKKIGNSAFSDAKHDFSIDITDKLVPANIKGSPGFVRMEAARKEFLKRNEGKTVFDVVGNRYPSILPSLGAGDYEALVEEATLKNESGFDLIKLRNVLKQFEEGNVFKANEGRPVDLDQGRYKTFSDGLGGQVIPSILEGQRKYKITAIPTKYRGHQFSLPMCFQMVTGSELSVKGLFGNCHLFVVIIDATTCGMSEFRSKEDLIEKLLGTSFNREQQYVLCLLYSNENEGDSATKIVEFLNGYNNVKIIILQEADDNYTSVFPAFTSDSESQLASLCFKGEHSLRRNKDGTVDGVTTYIDGGKIIQSEMKDVGENSNIDTVCRDTLNEYLLDSKVSNINIPLKLTEKRFGDWRQGLTMLDKNRKYIMYEIPDMNGKKNTKISEKVPFGPVEDKTVTLQELEDMGAKIAVMTLDKIFLLFCLLLGLNVLYSLKLASLDTTIVAKESKNKAEPSASINWLIWIQNEKTVIETVTAETVAALKAKITDEKLTELNANASAVSEKYLSDGKIKIEDNFFTTFPEFIMKLRTSLSTLKQMIPDKAVEDIKEEIKELRKDLDLPVDDANKKKIGVSIRAINELLYKAEKLVKINKDLIPLDSKTYSYYSSELSNLRELNKNIAKILKGTSYMNVFEDQLTNIKQDSKALEIYTDIPGGPPEGKGRQETGNWNTILQKLRAATAAASGGARIGTGPNDALMAAAAPAAADEENAGISSLVVEGEESFKDIYNEFPIKVLVVNENKPISKGIEAAASGSDAFSKEILDNGKKKLELINTRFIARNKEYVTDGPYLYSVMTPMIVRIKDIPILDRLHAVADDDEMALVNIMIELLANDYQASILERIKNEFAIYMKEKGSTVEYDINYANDSMLLNLSRVTNLFNKNPEELLTQLGEIYSKIYTGSDTIYDYSDSNENEVKSREKKKERTNGVDTSSFSSLIETIEKKIENNRNKLYDTFKPLELQAGDYYYNLFTIVDGKYNEKTNAKHNDIKIKENLFADYAKDRRRERSRKMANRRASRIPHAASATSAASASSSSASSASAASSASSASAASSSAAIPLGMEEEGDVLGERILESNDEDNNREERQEETQEINTGLFSSPPARRKTGAIERGAGAGAGVGKTAGEAAASLAFASAIASAASGAGTSAAQDKLLRSLSAAVRKSAGAGAGARASALSVKLAGAAGASASRKRSRSRPRASEARVRGGGKSRKSKTLYRRTRKLRHK